MTPRHPRWILAPLLLVLALASVPAQAAKHFVGGGLRYFRTVDDIKIDQLGKIDSEGSSLIFSYQVDPAGLFKFELDLEYFDGGYGDLTDEVISPQILALVGGTLYGGVGAGVSYISDSIGSGSATELFYVGRIGLQLTVLPRVHVDLNANYQSDVLDGVLDGPGSESITLGAIARVRIK